jgi:hypothetical protein
MRLHVYIAGDLGKMEEGCSYPEWKGVNGEAQELVMRGVASKHIDAALHHLFGEEVHKTFTSESLDEEVEDEGAQPSRTTHSASSSLLFTLLISLLPVFLLLLLPV